MNIDFGDKLSETVGYSNTDRDTGEKIRFRPRKNYLSQLLRHTQVDTVTIHPTYFLLQELGLVQKLGNIFTLFPERKEGIGGSQSGVCSPHIKHEMEL